MVTIEKNGQLSIISMDSQDVYALISFLLHAKFGNGPRDIIFTHDLINDIIRVLIESCDSSSYDHYKLDAAIDSDWGHISPEFATIKKFIDETFEGEKKVEMISKSLFPYHTDGCCQSNLDGPAMG